MPNLQTNFLCHFFGIDSSVGSDHGSSPEHQSSNGMGESKNLSIGNVNSTPDSDKSDSWDNVNTVGGEIPSADLGITSDRKSVV